MDERRAASTEKDSRQACGLRRRGDEGLIILALQRAKDVDSGVVIPTPLGRRESRSMYACFSRETRLLHRERSS